MVTAPCAALREEAKARLLAMLVNAGMISIIFAPAKKYRGPMSPSGVWTRSEVIFWVLVDARLLINAGQPRVGSIRWLMWESRRSNKQRQDD